jgi:iron(III) transport system substrate-binding protein
MRVNRIVVAAGLIGALALTACSTSGGQAAAEGSPNGDTQSTSTDGVSQELIAAAQAEGSVTWYSSMAGVTERTAAAFQEKYDIRVEVARIGSELLAPRYAQERAAGDVVADLVTIPEDFTVDEWVEEGWIEPMTDDVASLADFPDEYVFNDNSYALVNIQPIGFVYNTERVENAPTDWEDILAPEFQDSIVLADPNGILAWTELFRLLEEEYGEEYLTQFADMGYQLQPSAVPATQQVAAGEGTIAFPSLAALAYPLIEQGAPIELVIPDFTTGVNQYVAMSTDSDSPNASMLLMNYLLSEEGQAVLNEGQAASVLPDVPGTLSLPAEFVVPDLRQADEARAGLVSRLGL